MKCAVLKSKKTQHSVDEVQFVLQNWVKKRINSLSWCHNATFEVWPDDCGKVQFHSQLVATSSVVDMSTESEINNAIPNTHHPV